MRYLWAAMFRDGGEYGMAGAISGAAAWTVVLMLLFGLVRALTG